MIINRSNLAVAFTGFSTLFNQALAGVESLAATLAMQVPSTTAANQYGWLATLTKFREWVGDRQIQNLSTYDFTIKNKTFENTVAVDREAFEDDSYGVFSPIFQQLGKDAKVHPDQLLLALVKLGHQQVCYDGQYYFDVDHPVIQADGTTVNVSNSLAGAAPPWFLFDLKQFVKPLIFQKRRDYAFTAMDKPDDEGVFSRKEFRYGADGRLNCGYGLWQLGLRSAAVLDATSLQAAIAAMESFVGDNGEPLGVSPTHIVVPPALKYTARALVVAQQNAAGATNVMAGDLTVISTQRVA